MSKTITQCDELYIDTENIRVPEILDEYILLTEVDIEFLNVN